MDRSEKEIAKDLYSMKLLEFKRIEISKDEFYPLFQYVKRVPGGWIFYVDDKPLFVPYSDEFKP